MSLSTIFSDVESFFYKAEDDVELALTALKAGALTADNFIGTVLGQVEKALPIVADVNPALAAAISAGVAAVTVLQKAVAAALTEADTDVATITSDLAHLQAQAVTLAVQAAPFYQAVANDVAAVSADAVAAVAAVTGVTPAAA